ncbi:MAG: hypothetical protein BAA01_03480 [Bacillus thermozeamaize]|uniref:ABC transporter substrate-binding protein n=1 Tax=Bacillus thermozeamaize TaxID=230954 RepID=A0A1Y3PAA8_9BACI|nr:MAG: hypothetical protein BAA01_03480 [Bacillus thermozeamaize]
MKVGKKRFIVLAVVGLVFLLLAACGGNSQTQQSASQSSPSPSPSVQSGNNQPASEEPKQEASEWKPTKPITWIVPSNPGGGHDNNARTLAKYVEKYAGVTVNILNESGGGGVVAYNKLLQADPDGHTLLQVSTSLLTDQYLVQGAQYNHESFKTVAQIAFDPNHLFVRNDGPFKDMDFEQFIEYAKQNPNKVSMGVSGTWGTQDFVKYSLEKATGIQLQRVPIKGGAQIVLAVLAGDVDSGVLYPSEIRGNVEAGELKVLAHSGAERLSFWPEVPTFKEKGIDVLFGAFRNLVVPKETPDEIVQGLYRIIEQAMNDPDLKKDYEQIGIGYSLKNPEEATLDLQVQHDNYKRIIDENNLTPQ